MRDFYEKTIGVIVPSSDVNIEAAYHRFCPPEFAIATNRIAFNKISLQTLEDMLLQTERAGKDLCHVEPDILISSSLTIGCFRDSALQNVVEQYTGVPCLTALMALIHLLQQFGFCRIALLTPYQEDINILFKSTLMRQGVNVCYTKQLMKQNGQALQSIRDIQELSWEEIWNQLDIEMLRSSGADVLLFGASGLQGMEHIPEMEEMLGMPVLLAEQFTLLYALELLGEYRKLPALGWIFQQEPAVIGRR